MKVLRFLRDTVWPKVRAFAVRAAAAIVVTLAFASLLRFLLITFVLPGLIRSQVATALGREVSFAKVQTGSFPGGYIVYTDIKVAHGRTFSSGLLAHFDKVVLRFSPWPIVPNVFRRAGTERAIRRAELIRPVMDLDPADLNLLKPVSRVREERGRLPPLPRGLYEFVDGTIKCDLGRNVVLEFHKATWRLDLRDLPRASAEIDCVIAPDTKLSADLSLHFSLKNYKASLAFDRLDLARVASICRAFGAPRLDGLAGYLKASAELEGGFLTAEEFRNESFGRASLEVSGDRAVDVRRILLRELRLDKRWSTVTLPPVRPGKPARILVELGVPERKPLKDRKQH